MHEFSNRRTITELNLRDQILEVLEPFENFISISIDGNEFSVPENNTILRCFQYLDPENVSDSELCWNGDCLDCVVETTIDGKTRKDISCRTLAKNGMEISGVNPKVGLDLTEIILDKK